MPVSPLSPDARAALSAQVDHILDVQGLGRSPSLERLLRFLEICACEGRAPKEIQIADAVFDRALDDAATDASVRVYVHRLRRKLEEFYAGPGQDQPSELVLPRGSYLLTLSAKPGAVEVPSDTFEETRWRRQLRRWRHAWLGLTFVVLVGIGWLLGTWQHGDTFGNAARTSPVWRAILDDPHRQAIVLGDYYIFGERGSDGSVAHMRREFDVNSVHDLDEFKAMTGPEADKYVDLSLTYLPVGVGPAIRSISPIFSAPGPSVPPIPVVPISQLSGQVLQTSSLVYLGYLSALGPLRSPVFEGSRFRIGSSYDELVDIKTGHHYQASSHLEESDSPGQDYALISSFSGLKGNRIMVIAGTRDAALMAAADFMTRPDTLAQLAHVAAHGAPFEALIAVPALHNVQLDARLLMAVPRSNPSWTQGVAGLFPDDINEMTNARSSP